MQKLGILLIVIIAFIDGMLVAKSFEQEAATIDANTMVDIFEPVEIELPPETEVPFTIQAPLGWYKPYTDFSEEAAAYMAVKWAKDEQITSPQSAAAAMLEIGENASTSEEILALITGKHKYLKAFSIKNMVQSSLEQEIGEGHLLIVTVNGQNLENPYYGDPAPENHTLLIIGQTDEAFITHDPGTVRGKAYEYKKSTLMSALQGESIIVIEN